MRTAKKKAPDQMLHSFPPAPQSSMLSWRMAAKGAPSEGPTDLAIIPVTQHCTLGGVGFYFAEPGLGKFCCDFV